VSHLEFSFIVPPTSNRKQSATPEAVFKSKIRPQQNTISFLCYIQGRKDSWWGGPKDLFYTCYHSCKGDVRLFLLIEFKHRLSSITKRGTHTHIPASWM